MLGDFSTLCDVFFACPELDFGDGWDYGRNTELSSRPILMWTWQHLDVERRWNFWNSHHHTTAMDQTHKVHAAYDMGKYDCVCLKLSNLFSEQLKDLRRNWS